MHDSVIVGGFERFCDLSSDGRSVLQRKRTVHEPISQRHALDELENERRLNRARLLDSVNRTDVGMVERGEDLCFSFEAREALGIAREHLGKHLQRDVADKLRIASAIDLAHSARPEQRKNLVLAEPISRAQRHRKGSVSAAATISSAHRPGGRIFRDL